MKNFEMWFDEKGVKDKEKESIIEAYIKLTPWDWCEEYFNTSREHWKKTIFSGIRNKDYGAEYGKIIDNLLSCDDITKIEMFPGETDRATQIKKSLLDNKWFIRWMMSDKDLQWYRFKYYYFQKYNGRYYIPFDSGVNNFNEVFGSLFFSGRIRFDEKYYYRLIDDENGLKHFVFWSSSSMKIPFTFICEDKTEVGFYLYFDSYRNILFHEDEEVSTFDKSRTLYENPPTEDIKKGEERFYTVAETIKCLESLAKEKIQDNLGEDGK